MAWPLPGAASVGQVASGPQASPPDYVGQVAVSGPHASPPDYVGQVAVRGPQASPPDYVGQVDVRGPQASPPDAVGQLVAVRRETKVSSRKIKLIFFPGILHFHSSYVDKY